MGANAIEIDVYGWPSGWWADHDGLAASGNTTMEKMFKKAAEVRHGGANLLFVWLDLKNPGFDKNGHNIGTLIKLCRQILEPAHIKVLYGFYGKFDTEIYELVAGDLNDNEAVAIEGKADDVVKYFEEHGPKDIKKRCMSRGLFRSSHTFGKCEMNGKGICSELMKAKASGKLGKVFGWTISKGQKKVAEQMMGEAKVDGIIFGFVATNFYWHDSSLQAMKDIAAWISQHTSIKMWAKDNQYPW